MTHTNGTTPSRDGTPLFYEQWTPAGGSAWATLVVVPGRGEHTGRYTATAEALAAAGLAVWIGDLRGQGRSGGRRGHVTTWRDFLQDVQAIVVLASAGTPQQRPVLVGHSMGGLVALHYAVERAADLSGVIVSSPLCGLAQPVAPWEEWVACQLLSRWWPTFPFHRTTADSAVLSHDPRIQPLFLSDPLVHFRVTARLYSELTHAMGRIHALVQQLTLPTLVLQAGDDHIVSAEATRQMFAAVGSTDKRYIEYAGFYHELFNEVDAARVIRDIITWLRERCAAPATPR